MKHLLPTLSALILASCSFAGKAEPTFGEFSYNGIYLTAFSSRQITYEEAVRLAPSSAASNARPVKAKVTPQVENSSIDRILQRFAAVTTTVKYYVSEAESEQYRTEIFQGTDFRHMLELNRYDPFGQMSVNFVLIDTHLLSDMETENEEFKATSSNYSVPFKEPYTYHSNAQGELVLQTHSFSELPSSVHGGIGSTFRQDCELCYDAEGKLTAWQSSLGLYTSTPTGTSRQGYLFEVSFDWTLK